MRFWIDTDIGDNPDDTVALWCADQIGDADLAGISTVGGDVQQRAALVRELLPDVEVHAGAPPDASVADVDALIGLGPWTNIAALAEADALPRRVVMMGGALGKVRHRDEWTRTEHNVARDPAAAARLLALVGNLIVVPLDATARLRARRTDEHALTRAIPQLGPQLEAWRSLRGTQLPLVLHDPATALVALGEPIARMESKRLRVQQDGTMTASIDGPVQQVVAHLDAEATRKRVHELAVAAARAEGD